MVPKNGFHNRDEKPFIVEPWQIHCNLHCDCNVVVLPKYVGLSLSVFSLLCKIHRSDFFMNVLWVPWYHGKRVGEAGNPGPPASDSQTPAHHVDTEMRIRNAINAVRAPGWAIEYPHLDDRPN